MNTKVLIERVDFLINKGKNDILRNGYSQYNSSSAIDVSIYMGFRTACLSFISSLYGENHSYYKEYYRFGQGTYKSLIESGICILQSIRNEIEKGWLDSLRQLVSSEVFSDFLEMSKHLLDEKYKDPAAVMIGSVLEEHIRHLCINNNIEIEIKKDTVIKYMKAESMNTELVKSGVYGVLEQKSVTAWLDLRNRAAHGKYTEYNIEQVQLMYQGVLDFICRNS